MARAYPAATPVGRIPVRDCIAISIAVETTTARAEV
jgi:hypothetical protein